MQRRLRRSDSRRGKSKKVLCPLGCESCKTVSIAWQSDAGYGFTLRCETVRLRCRVFSDSVALLQLTCLSVHVQDDFGRRHRVSGVVKGGSADLAGLETKTAIIQVNHGCAHWPAWHQSLLIIFVIVIVHLSCCRADQW